MNFKSIAVSILALILSFALEDLSCKPLPFSDNSKQSLNGTLVLRRSLARRKRSIPELDAVNPAYQWGVERTAEEEPISQPALSPFNDLGALINFEGRKGPPARRSQQRPFSRVASGLTADEQVECYRQQNIDPPGPADGGRRVEYADAVPPRKHAGRNADRVRSRDNTGDVYSLYSDSQKPDRSKKQDWRVYRPAGVRPEFPVYDEDVDFHMMDPLQGILDDKYWLEPEVREATVRHYIDLAAANLMPPLEQMPFVKREVEKGQEKKNEKAPLKGGDRNCPCQEVVVACGSCDKGKKSNSTGEDVKDEGVSYGRKLLWQADDDGEDQEDGDEYAVAKQFEIDSLDESVPHYVGRKLLSIEEDEVGEHGGEESGFSRIEDSIGQISNYSEKYEEPNYAPSDKREHENKFQTEFDGGFESLEEDRISMSKPYFDRDDFQGSTKGDKKHYPDFTRNSSSALIEPGEGVEHEQNSIKDFTPGLYKPNKIANVLQRAMQKKPKATQPTTTINSNREFQKVNDELFANISKYKNTETVVPATAPVSRTTPSLFGTEANALQNKAKVARRSEDKKPRPNKKRSPSFASPSENVGSPDDLFDKIAYAEGDPQLFQSEQAQDAGGVVNDKGTSTSNDVTTQGVQTSTDAKYTVSSINPSLYLTGTVTASSTTVTPKTSKGKKSGAGDEETVDAEVANDIVDTVVAESQHGSVLGHRLGVCRRNESLMNIRYGRVVPEMEKVIKTVTGCIMDRLKAHLASQSCVLLETELSEFLKWIVLAGEQHKDYVQKIGEFNFLPTVPPTPDPKCREPLAAMEADTELPDAMPPNPRMFAGQSAEKLAV